MFTKFIWSRAECVKRKTTISDYKMGGIKMFHVKSFFESLKLSWIKKLVDDDVAVWKNIALYHVRKIGLNTNVFQCNCSIKTMNIDCVNIIAILPTFYSSLLKAWFITKHVVYKHSVDIPGFEILWNNVNIQLNNKLLFMPEWIRAGFLRVNDLFDNRGSLLSVQEIRHAMPHNPRVFIDYFIIHNAIPVDWKTRSSTRESRSDTILINNIQIQKCSATTFREIKINSMYTMPICYNYWSNRFSNYIGI
jgi:hypothetical protein